MPEITRDLLRKRAEHNEGMIGTLQELTLHQEELESINEVLGATCRGVKILYLQNNLIAKMQNLTHLKELEYINLALNNIVKIEGLQNCEFINKLDLTVNFIDFDELTASMDHLAKIPSLRDLYMMGNPSQANWGANFNNYVIARLPQIRSIDGTEITRSMQILARQQLGKLQMELDGLAAGVRREKKDAEAAAAAKAAVGSDYTSPAAQSGSVVLEDCDIDLTEDDELVKDGEKMTDNTPEARVEIYRELAAQKKEKADREKANQPRDRNYEKEQADAIAAIRQKEEEAGEREVRQKNEGGWAFSWDEESLDKVILSVQLSKHLDSSLIDVDIHPTFVSIVIKSKVLRLRLPAEVKAGEGKCQRSKVNGALSVIMPKLNPDENAISIRASNRRKEKEAAEEEARKNANKTSKLGSSTSRITSSSRFPKKLSLQEQLLAEASASAGEVDAAGVSTIFKSAPSVPNSGTYDKLKTIVPLTPEERREVARQRKVDESESTSSGVSKIEIVSEKA